MDRAGNEASGRMAAAWRQHGRHWKNHRYVYAVVSRRSRGISIGLNLNPDKSCNFDCIYCQVKRAVPSTVRSVNLERLSEELDTILQAEKDGSLYEEAPFNALMPAERGVRDIAFSGDGEPTAFRRFEEAVRVAAGARLRFGLEPARLVLLTNAAHLDKPAVRTALALLDANNGEIWAKLDAGTEDYFRKINRPHVSLERILKNILAAARIRPLLIQSLWCRIHGAGPPEDEIEAYCSRLNNLLSAGGMLKKIQLHTIARDPSETHAAPLSSKELDAIASTVQSRVAVPVEVFYSQ